MTRARDTANLVGSGNFSSTTFTATAGQTAFTISHTQGFVQVFMNGLLLDETVDYASNGTAITLTSGAAAGDEIEVVKYNTFSVGDAQTQAQADTRYANVSGDTFTGQLIAANSLQVGDASINQQYTNLGYIADFQASSGGQTYISIAEPGASSLGDTGVVIGEDTTNTYITQRGNKPIIIATQNLNRIVADGSGRVTMPYQPSFQAYRTNYTQNANAVGTIICPNVAHNTGNHYNSSNGTFTAPVAGKYLFMFWGLSYPHTTGVNYVAFYKNGGAYADLVQFGGNAQNHQPISGTMIIDCAVNDAITHVYYTQSAQAKAYSGQWNFGGHLLS